MGKRNGRAYPFNKVIKEQRGSGTLEVLTNERINRGEDENAVFCLLCVLVRVKVLLSLSNALM